MSFPVDEESRTISEVKTSTRLLLDSLKGKMQELKLCADDLKQLMRFGVDEASAARTADKFFGKSRVGYVAIDATQTIEEQLDLVVFYIGAFAYSGSVVFTGNSVEVGPPRARGGSVSASAAIPLSEEDAASVFGQRQESGVEVDAERLPKSLMHLSEYYLAYKAAAQDPETDIVILDRTLAGDVSHLVWSTRDHVWGKFSVLEGQETPSGRVTAFDVELARMLVSNKDLATPSPRSQFLKYAAVQELFSGDPLDADELLIRLGADPRWRDRLEKDLLELGTRFDIFESTTPFKLRKGAGGYWERVLHSALAVADHIFSPGDTHPLRVKNGGREVWVTSDDLDFLVLVFIRALTRKAWEENLLVVGLIKDTNAFELVKSAVPLLRSAGLLTTKRELPNFNSDKMLLQTGSVVNSAATPTPWHTFEIDAAFRTMAPRADPELKKGQARVEGAYENVIYQERVYLKTYVQLWSSEKNPSVRSHVFTFDRPVYPGYDHWDELELLNKDGPSEATIKPSVHFQRGSDLTNMVMAFMTAMGQEVIPEALGHNYPLFLADKKAKSILKGSAEACHGAVEIELAKSGLDQQVLFSRKFRDYRSQVEGQRRTA